MKKLFALFISFIMIFCCGLTGFADNYMDVPVDEEIIEEYKYTSYLDNSLSISGKNASCMSSVNGFYGTTTKIIITHTLQKKSGSSWVDNTSWTKTFNSWTAIYSTSKSSLSSGTYRLKTVAKVYKGSSYETITIYSSTASC